MKQEDSEYLLTTSLSYQLQAARQELADFQSGEVYRKLRRDYERIIRELNLTIKKLQKERDAFSFSRREITKQWMDVLEDIRNEELDEKRKKVLCYRILFSPVKSNIKKTRKYISVSES